MYVCNLQYTFSKPMNAITHAQFCSDPVESNHCVLESRSCVARVADRLFIDGGCRKTPHRVKHVNTIPMYTYLTSHRRPHYCLLHTIHYIQLSHTICD